MEMGKEILRMRTWNTYKHKQKRTMQAPGILAKASYVSHPHLPAFQSAHRLRSQVH